MNFCIYNDVNDFYTDVRETLAAREAQNMIMLGNLIIGVKAEDRRGWRDPLGWFMATVTDEMDSIVLVALMTPPHNLTLFAPNNAINGEAVSFFAGKIVERGVSVPGVMAERTLAELFAHHYSAAVGKQTKIRTSQRIYALTEVSPDISYVGVLRPMNECDLSYYPYWLEEFYREGRTSTASRTGNSIEQYRAAMRANRTHVLMVDGIAVSMAGIVREMSTVCGVGAVYTPPFFRGKGYATSCVAALSQLMLDRGFAACALYTDLANPTSNSIYQKIGYKPLCDSAEIMFEVLPQG